ncbi:MAG TPA: iron ABC transporter permease [Clostridiales bacterium]|nr:iron ABC transporter permease [Clostridiales bacterium]
MIREQTKTHTRPFVVFAIMMVLFIALLIANISIGSVSVPPEDIFRAIGERGGESTNLSIIWEIRMPRLIAGVVLGGALALAGFLLQTFFNNPLADPYVLGIASGAKLAVSLVMVFALSSARVASSAALISTAFLGAMLAMGFVLLLARKVRRMALLIVAGIMIGYICSAITDFVITFADDANIVNLHNWSRGSFSGIVWGDVAAMTTVVSAAAVFVFLLAKPISAYQLGEAYAQNMGLNIMGFRVTLILLSSLLAACVTAFAGPVSFVGIAVPHLVKTFLKTSRPILVIPACFLGGAIFCIGCDLIARTLFAPTELGISAVTAVFGAPVVLWMMVRRDKKH